MVRDIYPITKCTKKGLQMNIMHNNQPTCPSLEASRERVKVLDQCITEYREKVG